MASKNFLCHLLILVLFSYLTLSISSASSSGSGNIQHASMFNKPLQVENPKKELLELNDYPGTGPNPGHTPGPPPAGEK